MQSSFFNEVLLLSSVDFYHSHVLAFSIEVFSVNELELISCFFHNCAIGVVFSKAIFVLEIS